MNPKRDLSDQEIVRLVQRGDSDAFVFLVERHNERIFNVTCRLVGYQDAVDLTQEVFLKAFKSIGAFKSASSFATWIYRIALNTITSHRRKAAQTTVTYFESVPPEYEDAHGYGEPASTDPGPQELVLRKEEIEAVNKAIRELDEIDREIVVLRDIEGVSYQQIARILDVPMGTVKSRLFRARLALREKLGPLMEAPGPQARPPRR